MGRMARRRERRRRPHAAAGAARRQGEAPAPPPHRRGGAHLPTRHRPHGDAQGDADQPQPVREPLVAGRLARRLPHARRLPRRRRRPALRRGAGARPAGRDLPPAGRAALPAADRPGDPRVLRVAGLERRALAGARDRDGQRGDRRGARRHLRLPSLPWQPAQPLACLRRLRPDRLDRVPQGRRRPPAAGVRRRALGWLRATGRGARLEDGRARAGDHQVAAAGDRAGARGPHPRGRAPCRPRAARDQPAVRLRHVDRRQRADDGGSASQARNDRASSRHVLGGGPPIQANLAGSAEDSALALRPEL